MKKLLFMQIVLIVVFVLFAVFATAYTLLDAFVFDRPIADGDVTANPSFTLMPPVKNTAPQTTKDHAPEATPSSDHHTAITTNTPVTSTPVTSAFVPDSNSTSPVTTPSVTTDVHPTVTTPEETTEPIPEIQYPIIEDLYYKDENIEIDIEENYFHREVDGKNGTYVVETVYFVIDIKLSHIEYLRTHFRMNDDEEVVKATTSELAEDVGAIFAINGDYFSFRDSGFVIRNYEYYRDTRRNLKDPVLNGDDALFVLPNGSLMMFDENNSIFDQGLPSGIFHCFSFGPRLIEYGDIMVDEDSEAGQSAESNPRTAIGMVEPLHYKIVVSEGRLVDEDGLTLLDLALIMKDLGCEAAYNLDGGSSTTLYFNGEVINIPGRSDGSERRISDIIYINGKRHPS